MKVEQLEQTQDEVIELSASQTMKSLMSGEDPPPIVEETKEPDQEVVQTDAENKEPEKTEPTVQELLQAQAAEIDKLRRTLDKTNGTYGNELNHLKRKLAEVESRKSEAVRNITPAQLKRIGEQYPELADALASDLTDAFSIKDEPKEQVIEQPKNDPRIDNLNESTGKLAEQVKTMALAELSRTHPDWKQVAGWDTESIPGVGDTISFHNPEFGVWVKKQDDDVKNIVFNGEDINAIADVISKFKQSIKAPETPTENKTVTNKKLEKAVLPTGRRTGAHELLTEDEEIANAAQEERKRIMNGY